MVSAKIILKPDDYALVEVELSAAVEIFKHFVADFRAEYVIKQAPDVSFSTDLGDPLANIVFAYTSTLYRVLALSGRLYKTFRSTEKSELTADPALQPDALHPRFTEAWQRDLVPAFGLPDIPLPKIHSTFNIGEQLLQYYDATVILRVKLEGSHEGHKDGDEAMTNPEPESEESSDEEVDQGGSESEVLPVGPPQKTLEEITQELRLELVRASSFSIHASLNKPTETAKAQESDQGPEAGKRSKSVPVCSKLHSSKEAQAHCSFYPAGA